VISYDKAAHLVSKRFAGKPARTPSTDNLWSMDKTATTQNSDRSKRRHRNGDRNGYIHNGNKPLQF